MSSDVPGGKRRLVERLIGGFLLVTAGLGVIFWFLFAFGGGSGPGESSFRIGTFQGSGVVEALLATPTVLALAATQAVLGIGLLRRRPWVGWYGLAYVGGSLLFSTLQRVLPDMLWVSLTTPLLGAIPGGVLLWRSFARRRLLRKGQAVPPSLVENEPGRGVRSQSGAVSSN